MQSETQTSSEYIQHHITNLTYGKFPDGSWGIAHSIEEAKAMGFNAIHVDTMFWSISLGVVFCALFYLGDPQSKGWCAGYIAECMRNGG